MTEIRMANTFVASVARLSARDTKHVVGFVDKVMQDTARAGLALEQVHDARDAKIRSARVSSDLRVILHVDGRVWLLLYADHHDAAYEWARTKCIECHMVTGALQIVEAPEPAEERLAAVEAEAPPVFAAFSDEYLLSLGVPPSWLPAVRMVHGEDGFLQIAEDLPEDVCDRLLTLMSGDLVPPPAPRFDAGAALEHPDTRRWLCTVTDSASACELLDDAGGHADDGP